MVDKSWKKLIWITDFLVFKASLWGESSKIFHFEISVKYNLSWYIYTLNTDMCNQQICV